MNKISIFSVGGCIFFFILYRFFSRLKNHIYLSLAAKTQIAFPGGENSKGENRSS
jgi:hypothetical protein